MSDLVQQRLNFFVYPVTYALFPTFSLPVVHDSIFCRCRWVILAKLKI